MSMNIIIKGDREIFQTLENAPLVARHLLREAIQDIGDNIEKKATEFAPVGEGIFSYTGTLLVPGGVLKAHPVDRTDSIGTVAQVRGEAAAFRSIRGGGGRFVKGKGGGAPVGNIVALTQMTVPEEPFYAKFVHYGTRTPITSPTERIMKFYYKGKQYRAKAVRGQDPNPYLEKAYQFNRAYAEIRFQELKAQIEALINL